MQTIAARYPTAWIWVGVVLAFLLGVVFAVSMPRQMHQGQSLVTAELVPLAPDSQASPRQVELPHVFDDEEPKPIEGAWRYRIDWPRVIAQQAGKTQSEPQALLIARIGARFRVWLDGHLIHSAYWDTPGYVDTSVVPHLVLLPASLDMTQPHRLEVDVYGVLLRKSGMGAAMLGPVTALQERFDKIYWWQVYLNWMVSASSGVLALLAGLIWWVGRDKVFGLFALAAVSWMVRLALTPVVHPPMPFEVWFFLHKITFTLYCGFVYLFLWHLFDLQHKLALYLVRGLMTVGPLWIMWIVLTGEYDGYRLWTAGFAMTAVVVFGFMLHKARWGLDPDRRLMVVVSVVMLVTGLRDFLVVQMDFPGDADMRWMTPGSLLFSLTLGLMLMQRVGLYVAKIKELNSGLEEKIRQKEEELTVAFDRIREVEMRQVLVNERARLTRDMHDGLGSQLVQTLNAVRSGQEVSRDTMQHLLSHALEELRMTIDSMEQMEGDLPTILGTLRRRIGPALESAGIGLVWDVHDVPALLDPEGNPLEARSVMHLFRCLQEVFANVIKHAGASRVCVSTALADEGVVMSVTDNGRGMERTRRDGGRGLANIRARAAAIGAQVEWGSPQEGSGTQVRFVFTRYSVGY